MLTVPAGDRQFLDDVVRLEEAHRDDIRSASGSPDVQLGIHFMNFGGPRGTPGIAPTLAEAARTADDAGVSWFTVMDHYFQMEHYGQATDPMLEAYTTLGFLAGQTSNLRLGALVTGVTYRHPGLLAKIVTTLDVLSGGRAMLGIGAAWYEREHRGLGVPYPAVPERFERLEETLQIVLQMWGEDEGPYTGRHFQLGETINSPQPLHGRPQILIGGVGEKRTLRLVAQYADACNFFAFGPDFISGKLDVLARHCDEVDRDVATIHKTILGGPDPLADTDAFIAEMERYAALGIGHVQLAPPAEDPVGFIAELADRVLPRLAEVTTA